MTERKHAASRVARSARVRLNHAHGWLYALGRGRIAGSMGGRPVLLLTTTGRHTGRPRRTPVQYERIDGDLLIVAAGGGAPRPPAWWHNLEATAEVTVQIRGERQQALALTLTPEERAAVWPKLCARNRHLEPLQQRAGREFPVVHLVSAVAQDSPLRRHLQGVAD